MCEMEALIQTKMWLGGGYERDLQRVLHNIFVIVERVRASCVFQCDRTRKEATYAIGAGRPGVEGVGAPDDA